MKIETTEGRFKPSPDGKAASAENGMVATAFPDATQAGIEMLRQGGNAVDAACASALALGVCEPQASGIGGQTMAILHLRGNTITIDGSTRAPSLAHISQFEQGDESVGYRATTVPSTIAVLGYLNFRYGRLDWPAVVQPAIRIAKEGYAITPLQQQLQERSLEKFLAIPSRSGARTFLKGGEAPYAAGEIFKQPELAATLEHIARNGPRSFYQGRIAKQIDADMRANDGFLRADDLALMPWPVERPAIRRRYRGLSIVTLPPPAAGRTLLLVMLMLNHLPSRFLRRRSREFYHFVAETFRKAFLQRQERPFDPNTYPQFPDRNTMNLAFAREQAKSIRDEIDVGLPLIDPPAGPGETTHLSVMDGAGNAVGITQSIELVYGSKATAEGLGFLYNNYMGAFEVKNPAHPFYLRAQQHSLDLGGAGAGVQSEQAVARHREPGQRAHLLHREPVPHPSHRRAPVDGRSHAPPSVPLLHGRNHQPRRGTLRPQHRRISRRDGLQDRPARALRLLPGGHPRGPAVPDAGRISGCRRGPPRRHRRGLVMSTLPVLLSIPHGGVDIPEEIRHRVMIDANDVHDDIDPFVREIYDLGRKVLHVVSTSTARTFVDLNRARDDRPPENPDGVVKTLTCVGKAIFAPGRELDASVTETLLERYYEPYHDRLRSAMRDPAIRLALDCHSMQPVGPVISPDAGRPRPVFCLGNARGAACPQALAQRLADCLRRAFDLREGDVTLNEPFSGGYITRAYGGRPLPWIQVEMNRSQYLAPAVVRTRDPFHGPATVGRDQPAVRVGSSTVLRFLRPPLPAR